LAGLKAFIWSNLCTRHIQNKLTPRGHEDWPDKRTTRKLLGFVFTVQKCGWRKWPPKGAA